MLSDVCSYLLRLPSSVRASVMAIFVAVLADNGSGLEDTSFKAQ